MGAAFFGQFAPMVFLTKDLLPILVFGVVMPALDQFSDVAFALRLMGGPADDTILLTGITTLHSAHLEDFFSLQIKKTLLVVWYCLFQSLPGQCDTESTQHSRTIRRITKTSTERSERPQLYCKVH